MGTLSVQAATLVVVLVLALASSPRAQVAADVTETGARHHVDGVLAVAGSVEGGENASLPVPTRSPASRELGVGQRRRHGRGRKGGRPRNAAPAATASPDVVERHVGKQHRAHAKKKGHKQGMEHKRRDARENNKKHKNNKNRERGWSRHKGTQAEHAKHTEQQVRHRKQRQSRRQPRPARRNQTSAGSSPGATDVYRTATLRLRSEEKQDLVGRRTLQVLSPAAAQGPPPSPTLVGILDIPAPTVEVATKAAGFKLTARTGSAVTPVRDAVDWPSRSRRPDPDVDVDSKPLDPDWLQRLLAAATQSSAKAASNEFDETVSPCDRWMSCSAKLKTVVRTQLAALPSCPCTFPANVFYYNKIWDPKHNRYFRWRDASGRAEKLDVYHPGASHCIRSASAGMLSAQHCCYDRNRQLLTRGSGAGTPALVSPDVSAVIHDTLDVRPWRVCKGDFTKYNELRPPNNDNHCAANPDDAEFQRQRDMSQFY